MMVQEQLLRRVVTQLDTDDPHVIHVGRHPIAVPGPAVLAPIPDPGQSPEVG